MIQPYTRSSSAMPATLPYKRHGVAASKGLPSNHSIAVFSWVKHKDHDCDVSYTVKIDKSWVKHKYHDCDVSYTVRIDKVKLQ